MDNIYIGIIITSIAFLGMLEDIIFVKVKKENWRYGRKYKRRKSL